MASWQWGVRFTTEYLRSDGSVEETAFRDMERNSERDARDVVYDAVRRMQKGQHPKGHRTTDARLIRRPIGDWEEVE